jgi:dTMP kinase
MPDTGKLIALEGADEQLLERVSESLHHWMCGLGVEVERTAEPTNGPVGVQVQLCREGRLALPPESVALLWMADRLDHLAHENGMLSWLDSGRHVLCARYLLSSLAQLYDQVPFDWHMQINARCRPPDLTLCLDSVPLASRVADACSTDFAEIVPGRTRALYARVAQALSDRGETVCWIDDCEGIEKIVLLCQREIARLLLLGET